jgi:hypothetical protein
MLSNLAGTGNAPLPDTRLPPPGMINVVRASAVEHIKDTVEYPKLGF